MNRYCTPSTLFATSLLLVTTLIAPLASALGANGHRIVAQLAENHLTPNAKAVVMEITGGKQLAQLANWPDFIRSDSSWKHASAWHYVSVEDKETVANYPRKPEGDILQALEKFENVLRDPTSSAEQKWQALAFYTHFVGDIHQPLHVGRSADLGGNTIKINWLGKATNLHAVWDSELIEHEKLSYSEYTSFIDFVTVQQVKQWQAASYQDWAAESKALRQQVYSFGLQKGGEQKGSEVVLGWSYFFHNHATVDSRLQQAGIRLAGKLNEFFAVTKAAAK